jgi:Ca-activated chloride channel family protein
MLTRPSPITRETTMRSIRHAVAAAVAAVVLCGFMQAPAFAAAATARQRVTEGTLLVRTAETAPSAAPMLKTDVDLRVTGPIARATVRQEFANPGQQWAEGVYVFPLPEDAAVDHLRMWVGNRVIEGMIRERAQAKAEYEQAKKDGKRASLVEQERPNIFTTSVANIPPGGTIAIEIEYQQPLRWDDGRYRLRFPMVVGPRYIPGADTDQVPDASRITPPVIHPSQGPINPVTLRVTLAPGAPLATLDSPYHRIRTTPRTDGTYEVELTGPVPADRDFELVWEPVAGAAPAAVVFTEGRPDGVYALLMVTPPRAAAQRRTPREVVLVIDNSGSMAGASIQQAKAALQLALARLGPADTFNVIRFNHTTSWLFESPQPATPDNQRAASRWVDALRAEGGTEMLAALQRALAGGESDGRLRQVVFLTDGAVGNEDALFATIRERLGDRRLFTVGIGSAPNSHFMRQAARHGRGTFTYIGSVTEVRETMEALFRKLETPALTDLTLDLPGVAGADVVPQPIPDLYIGEPVVVALRAGTLPARAVLRGRVGDTAWEHDVPVMETSERAGVSVHWAREKIGVLLDARRAAADADVRKAVIALALAHHLVSPYTSLVAVDVTPARPADAALGSHAMPTNLPHGWSHEAVFGLGQGATPATLHAMLGVAALLLALTLCVLLRRNLALAAVQRARRRS